MPSPETALAFFLTALILGISPGPDIIFVLTQSALYGTKAGVFTTLGLSTGLCLQTLAVALGLVALLQLWPPAFIFLKICGALWLCWLAWQTFQAKPVISADAKGVNFPGLSRLYLRGVIMNITNPKVCVFFLAFLPQFCDPQKGNIALQTVFFGFLFVVATLIVFCGAACLGGRLALWLNSSPRLQLFINRLAGCIFLGLAVSLFFVES